MMNCKTLIGIILSLSVMAMVACSGMTEKPAQGTTTPEGPKLTVKGKIDFTKSMGGYFVRGLDPGGELFIVNQKPKVLEERMKSGKILAIEGRITKGAEYLFIENIDGQPY